MAKTKSRSKNKSAADVDGVYFLKIVLYLIVGMQWLWFENANGSSRIPIPIGLIVGYLFALHEHFRIDRKIEYAVLLVAMFIGFWAQAGIAVHYTI